MVTRENIICNMIDACNEKKYPCTNYANCKECCSDRLAEYEKSLVHAKTTAAKINIISRFRSLSSIKIDCNNPDIQSLVEFYNKFNSILNEFDNKLIDEIQ